MPDLAQISSATEVRHNFKPAGALIINADDWGEDRETTQKILDCILCGAVSAVSGMVFMSDSARAAEIATERMIDVGLHLNLTTRFSGSAVPEPMAKHQERIARRLRKNRFASALFHPDLTRSFEYVIHGQMEEFHRLYGRVPGRIDGHHHMHLCANVIFSRLLPEGITVRRNFSFAPGEKGWANRFYRRSVDGMLARRYHLADFFFSLAPIEVKRIEKIFALAKEFTVEVETHPVNPDEYGFLTRTDVAICSDTLQRSSPVF